MYIKQPEKTMCGLQGKNNEQYRQTEKRENNRDNFNSYKSYNPQSQN